MRSSIDVESIAKKGMNISDIHPENPFTSDSKPGIKQQTNRNTMVSIVYPDSFLIDSHVFDGENRIPFTLCFNFT
jgi:hypothetical protein